MNKKELLDRLKFHEWDDFEVKEAKKEVPKDVWKTVGAFSNTGGGIVVFGVKETGSGKLEISGVENIEKVQNDFISTLRGEKFNIPLSTKGHIFDFNGKKVLLFRINAMPVSCKPIYFGGDIRNTYSRQGSGDHKCSKEEVGRMLREASELSSDSMILKGYTIDDIDSETVTIYKKFLNFKYPDSPFLIMEEEPFLKKLGCLTQARQHDHGNGIREELTMAGLLLFGKEDSIRARFPAYELDIYLVPRNDRIAQGVRWNDRKIYEVNLVKTYLEAMEYLKSKIEIPFALAEDHMTRTEEVPVVIALREALVNMIIHRDYFDHTQSRIKIYQDCIETFNPGSTPKTVKEIIENEVTEPRNPVIAKLFRIIGWSEVAGSGMMKILKNWKAAGFVEPHIENNVHKYYFKMTFPFKELSDQYIIGTRNIIKESAYGNQLVIDRSLYDYVNDRENDTLNDTLSDTLNKNDTLNDTLKLTPLQEEIAAALKDNKDSKIDEIAERLGKSIPTIKRHIDELKKMNVLERVGSKRNGHWKMKNHDSENDTLNDTLSDTLNKNDTLNDTLKLTPLQEEITAILRDNKDIKIDEIAEQLVKSIPTIKRHIDELKKMNVLERAGSKKNGHWRMKNHD